MTLIRLWPAGLKLAFRHRPASATTESDVYHRFDRIRRFRNRVAHHDPIWDRGFLAEHDYILDSLAWMAPKLADALRVLTRAPAVYAAGPGAYRPLAEEILGTGPGRAGDPIARVVAALRAVPVEQRDAAADAMLRAVAAVERSAASA